MSTKFSSDLLSGKRLLCISPATLITEEHEIPPSSWCALKQLGLSALYMVLESSTENKRWVKRLHELGVVDEYNVDGLVREQGEYRPINEVVGGIVNWIQEKQLKIDGCISFGDFTRLIHVSLCGALSIPTDSFSSVEAAYLKNVTQNMIKQSPIASKYWLESHVVTDEDVLLKCLDSLSYPVIMKPVNGVWSSGCQLMRNLDSCRNFFHQLKRDMMGGGPSCEKLAYKNEVLVMEYAEGATYCVDVCISNGSVVLALVATQGPPPLPSFELSTVSVPSALQEEEQNTLIAAAHECCNAIGLRHGYYSVELAWDGHRSPRLIEVNARPSGANYRELIKLAYDIDVFVYDAMLALNIDPGLIEVKRKHYVVAYIAPYIQECNRSKYSFAKMEALKESWGVHVFNPDSISAREYLLNNSRNLSSTHAAVIVSTHEFSRKDAIANLSNFLVECQFFDNAAEIALRF